MPSDVIIALRKQLREKFPSAHLKEQGHFRPDPALTRREAPHSSSNLPDLHSLGDGGKLGASNFPSGAITEISPAHPSCGLSLIIPALLSENTGIRKHGNTDLLVLIDARDRFDPASFSPEECARLLWLRCQDTTQALRAADLLVRDGNLSLILLDLSALPARELRRIPRSSWHRLRQLAETTDTTLLALTPSPLIPRTALRISLSRQFTLDDLQLSRPELLTGLHTQTTRHLHRTA